MKDKENITWHNPMITKNREGLKWSSKLYFCFTGLSGSGKSMLTNAAAKALFNRKIRNLY